jgi:uncharacterized membrane protein
MPPKTDIGKSLKEAWEMFKAEWQMWVLATFLFGLITTVAMILLVLPLLLVAGPLQAGMFHMALKQLRGQKLEVGDLFWGFSHWMDTALLGIVVGFIIMVGMILCIVPGIIFMAWYMFAFPLLVDRGLSWGDAMTESKKLTTQNLMDFIIFGIVAGFISSVGSYACYIGILVTLPLYYLMISVAYRDLFGLKDQT